MKIMWDWHYVYMKLQTSGIFIEDVQLKNFWIVTEISDWKIWSLSITKLVTEKFGHYQWPN